MLNRLNQLGCILALTLGAAGVAKAQSDDGGETEASNPCDSSGANPCSGDETSSEDDSQGAEEGHTHGMVTPQGAIALTAAVGVNLSSDAVGDPVALAPDIRYGVMNKLDAGLYHSAYGITGFWQQNGGGLCLVGDSCSDTYNGPTAILANYSLAEGALGVTAGGGIVLDNIAGDALLLDLKVGAKVHYTLGEKMALAAEPALFVSATERDPQPRDLLSLPLAFMYAIDAKTHAGVQSGITGPLDNFGEAYQIPLSVAGMYQLDGALGVGGAFGFSNLMGKGGTADERNLTLFAHYML